MESVSWKMAGVNLIRRYYMVKVGDKIKTKFGIGEVTRIFEKDNRFVIVADYKIQLPIYEGDDTFEVI